MFCKNCGKELADGTNFCNHCGAAQGSVSPTAVPTASKKSNGKKIGGIIMSALGGLSVLGSIMNDYYYNIINNGFQSSDFITVGLQLGLIIGGIILISKSLQNKY